MTTTKKINCGSGKRTRYERVCISTLDGIVKTFDKRGPLNLRLQ